uniref:Uncharacterized protein n=1 Tax=Glossina palpalis gambiensis TaxID=67801 RepID=A0A1B0BDU4_9MUSC
MYAKNVKLVLYFRMLYTSTDIGSLHSRNNPKSSKVHVDANNSQEDLGRSYIHWISAKKSTSRIGSIQHEQRSVEKTANVSLVGLLDYMKAKTTTAHKIRKAAYHKSSEICLGKRIESSLSN